MITSKQNEKFKSWMKLKQKKYRDQSGLFLVYGQHLVDLAIQHEAIHEIITTSPDVDGTLIDLSLMKSLSQTETTFDIMAVCRIQSKKISSDRVLMLDDVQDPDNVGALIRSAVAFGYRHIILGKHSADVYNEKVIRASKGAFFDARIERVHLKDGIKALKDDGYAIYIADVKGDAPTQIHGKMALILGNEGHGIHPELKSLADGIISIPTTHVESLNVSVAGSILMYLWRQA